MLVVLIAIQAGTRMTQNSAQIPTLPRLFQNRPQSRLLELASLAWLIVADESKSNSANLYKIKPSEIDNQFKRAVHLTKTR
jgi:hypothetical protein